MLSMKIKIFIIALILNTTTMILPEQGANSVNIENQKWDAFKEAYIKDASLNSRKAPNKAIQIGSTSAIFTGLWANLSLYFNSISTKKFIPTSMNDCEFGKIGLVINALISAYITRNTYRKMHEWILAREEQKSLKKYIENWEQTKNNTPQILYPILEKTVAQYKENPSKVDFSETARILKSFYKNYKKRDKSKESKQAIR